MPTGENKPANETGTRGGVLIIDDEADFADYLRNVAVLEGFEARLVSTLSDFADALDAFNPAVVIMDMVMPETDGFEILRFLAARNSPAKVLIVSGYTPLYLGCAVKMAQGLGLETVITLQKPVKLKDLRAALAEPPAAFTQPPRDRGQARQAGAD
jgi:DNA-binding response OmpR family regulator